MNMHVWLCARAHVHLRIMCRYFGDNVMSDVKGKTVKIQANKVFHWGHQGGPSDVCTRCGG